MKLRENQMKRKNTKLKMNKNASYTKKCRVSNEISKSTGIVDSHGIPFKYAVTLLQGKSMAFPSSSGLWWPFPLYLSLYLSLTNTHTLSLFSLSLSFFSLSLNPCLSVYLTLSRTFSLSIYRLFFVGLWPFQDLLVL